MTVKFVVKHFHLKSHRDSSIQRICSQPEMQQKIANKIRLLSCIEHRALIGDTLQIELGFGNVGF